MRRIELEKNSKIQNSHFRYIEDVENKIRGGSSRRRIKVICKCGNNKIVYFEDVRRGNVKSCGCIIANYKHGGTAGGVQNRIYKISADIITRTTNKNNRAYQYYGKRGIKCRFANIKDVYIYLMSLPNYSEKMTIDRIDNNGHYEKGNLRWVTRKQNSRNRRNNIIVTYKGKEMTLAEAIEKSGLSSIVVRNRINSKKWSIDRALSEPKHKYHEK